MTVRAVHIEVVNSLDVDSCMAAIRRFIARRGKPHTIMSDNGTNFVAAKKEIERYFNNEKQNALEESLHREGIIWKLNPPGAPHFGGA